MLRSARGGALQEAGIHDIICGLAALGADHPEIGEVDVNPVLVGRDRTVAVDALVVRTPGRPVSAQHQEAQR